MNAMSTPTEISETERLIARMNDMRTAHVGSGQYDDKVYWVLPTEAWEVLAHRDWKEKTHITNINSAEREKRCFNIPVIVSGDAKDVMLLREGATTITQTQVQNNMEPYQQRVVEEKAQLDDKRQKLADFMQGPNFKTVQSLEQGRLYLQEAAMQFYSNVLGQRIEAFSAQAQVEPEPPAPSAAPASACQQ